MQVRTSARIDRNRFVIEIRELEQFVRRFRELLREHADMLERFQLVRDDAGVIVIAIHLPRVDAERELGGVVVAQSAFRSAGEAIVLRDRLVADFDIQHFVGTLVLEQVGIGLIFVPDIGVAAPVLVSVLLGAWKLLEVKEACFEAFATFRIASFHVHAEGLDEDGAIGELPAGRSAGGGLRIGNFVEADLAIVGDCDEAFLFRVIAPERGIDGIRDNARCNLVVLGGCEDAGLAELAGEVLGRVYLLVGLCQLINPAAGEIAE